MSILEKKKGLVYMDHFFFPWKHMNKTREIDYEEELMKMKIVENKLWKGNEMVCVCWIWQIRKEKCVGWSELWRVSW